MRVGDFDRVSNGMTGFSHEHLSGSKIAQNDQGG